MPTDPQELDWDELAVLSLLTEDAFALWEVVHEVGGERTAAVRVLRSLYEHGFVQFGVEDWSQDPPAHYVDGRYVDVPLTETVDEALADRQSWDPNAIRKVVASATPAGVNRYFRDGRSQATLNES